MRRRFLFLAAGVLALLWVMGDADYLHAQPPSSGFNRGFLDPRFNRGFLDPRFSSGFFDPRFNRGFLDPRFNRGFFDPRFNP
jgi:hypothetical protein